MRERGTAGHEHTRQPAAPTGQLAGEEAAVKVSVVIPCYNRSRYLDECLQSVAALAGADWEVVVVDDGSTEDVRSVAERFAPLVRYIRQPNRGPGAARNTGVRATRGRYIRFFDSDDVLLSAEVLARQVALLDERPDIGLVYAQALKIDEQGHPYGIEGPAWAHESYVHTGDVELEHLLIQCYIPTSTVIVRRAVFEGQVSFPDYPTAQDWACWLRVAQRWSVAYVAEPLEAYRRHDNSITSRKSADTVMRVHEAILHSMFADPVFARRYAHVRGPAYAHRTAYAASLAYRGRDMRSCRRYARRAILLNLRHRRWVDARGAGEILLRSLIPPGIREQLKSRRSIKPQRALGQ